MENFWGVLPALLGMAGLIGSAFAVYLNKSTDNTVSTLSVGNAELRSQNDDLRTELKEEKEKRIESEQECATKIARLEMKVELLEGNLVQQLIETVKRKNE